MGALEGKIAVITGGNSGIGLATAEWFVKEGAYAFITARRQVELDKAVSLIGSNVTAVQGDVTRMEDLDRIAASCHSAKRMRAVTCNWKGIVMAKSDIEKVLTVFAGISAGDGNLATQYLGSKRFVQHNPNAAEGVEGLREFISQSPRDQLQMTVVRTLQDGPYVVTQAKGQRSGQNVFFDIFRFEDGLVVEHWAFSAKDAPPNQSGHTQMDGPTEPKHLEDTEKNKSLVRKYYETFHLRGDHSRTEQYFSGDLMIRHEPGVRDGVGEFLRDVEVLMQHRTIDTIEFLLGQGDLVFIAARGTHEGQPCVYIDLYRVQDEKIVEHWGFPEMVPPPEQWRNNNGML